MGSFQDIQLFELAALGRLVGGKSNQIRLVSKLLEDQSVFPPSQSYTNFMQNRTIIIYPAALSTIDIDYG